LGYLLEKLNATEFSEIIKENLKLSSVYIKFSRLAGATGLKNKAWPIYTKKITLPEIDDSTWKEESRFNSSGSSLSRG